MRNVAIRLLAEYMRTKKPLEHVHFISLEMPAEDIAAVNFAQVGGLPVDRLRSGQIGGPDEWLKLEGVQLELGELPIIIDSPGSMTLSQVAARCRIVKRTKRTRLIVIDYRELIRPDKAQERLPKSEWIPFIGPRLKALAKSLKVPILALCQINKAKDNEPLVRPQLKDLPYDSGADADAVFAAWRPEVDMANEPPEFEGAPEKIANARSAWYAARNAARGVLHFGAVKRRFGPQVWVKTRFDGPRMLVVDAPPAESDPLLEGRWE
ncbi:MAG: hypothetical protein JSS56_25165 [Proteobacteria bacterium]|nr:hypothetical protein [Pseudomonadota bacterium]